MGDWAVVLQQCCVTCKTCIGTIGRAWVSHDQPEVGVGGNMDMCKWDLLHLMATLNQRLILLLSRRAWLNAKSADLKLD
jgi:hypothetical protein